MIQPQVHTHRRRRGGLLLFTVFPRIFFERGKYALCVTAPAFVQKYSRLARLHVIYGISERNSPFFHRTQLVRGGVNHTIAVFVDANKSPGSRLRPFEVPAGK